MITIALGIIAIVVAYFAFIAFCCFVGSFRSKPAPYVPIHMKTFDGSEYRHRV